MEENYIVEGTPEQLSLLLETYNVFNGIENGNLELVAEVMQPLERKEEFYSELINLKNLYLKDSINRERIIFSIINNRITCSKEHLGILSLTCDKISRIQICQFDNVADIAWPVNNLDFEKMWDFRRGLDSLKFFWDMTSNMSYSIFSKEVSDTARTLWDMHQVIRNRLAYDSNPGVTPGNRWERRKFTVDFDEPFHANKEIPLIRVMRVIDCIRKPDDE